MKWLNALGLIFQFLAFWFAAPELLGAATLKRLESGLQKFVTLVPIFITLLIIFGYGFVFVGTSLYHVYMLAETGTTPLNMKTYYIVLSISSALYMLFIFRYKKVRKYLETRVAIPLIERLINNTEVRKTALLIGAILFTVGFLAQLIVVILG